jgi:Carboxypeptidase regulatory-like domain
VNRAFTVLVLFAGACAIREPRTSSPGGEPCTNNEQCDTSVCFLGECRAPSSALSTVYAEVRSSDPRYGTLQQGGIDLRQTALVDFTLEPVVAISGHVTQGSTPVPGASVVFTDAAPKIPDRVVSVSAQSDSSGAYTATLPASTYQVRVAPANLPVAQFGPVQPTQNPVDLALPAPASLAHMQGVLVVNGSNPLAGAQVSAVDGNGTSISTTHVSGTDGSFSLDLPPGPPAFSLQIGPQTGPSASAPIPTFTPRVFPAGQAANLGTIDLGALPPIATLTGKVVDARGAPVASTRVLVVGTGATGFVLSRQATTGADGTFSVVLLQGNYLVQAMPDVDPQAPGISPSQAPVFVQAPATQLAQIGCPDKIRVTGTVLRPDGRAAPAGFRVEATRVPDQVIPGRGTQTATTDAAGAFSLVLDGGHYRVAITPTAESALPRTIFTLDLAAGAAPSLRIAPAHELVGTIRAASSQAPVPGATIDFYSLDASGKRSVLIGSAVADPVTAQYKVVLPDVSQPAGQ